MYTVLPLGDIVSDVGNESVIIIPFEIHIQILLKIDSSTFNP